MKKVFLAIYALAAFSCSNEDVSYNDAENTEFPSVSTIYVKNGEIQTESTRSSGTTGKKALYFKDEKVYAAFLTELARLDDNAKEKLIKTYRITNLYDVADSADFELERIGDCATSEEDFREKYAAYILKYSGKLIKNPEDDTDLSLYIPDRENIETYIGNEDGVFVVANKVRKVNLNRNFSYNTIKLTSASSATPTNNAVYSPKSGKRIYFNAYTSKNYLIVSMHAQKKMWYGWKNDPARSYYFDSYINSNFFKYVDGGKYGQEIIVDRYPRYVYKNAKNGFSMTLGKLTAGNRITGYINTWTDMTSEHDTNGNELTEKIGKYIVPKCTVAKAYKINIDLQIQN